MSLTWISTDKKNNLIETPLSESKPGVFEADVRQATILTDADIQGLKKVHGKRALNLYRAEQVKRMLIEGRTVAQMVGALRSYPGCGERMVRYDVKALPYRKRKT